MPILFGMNHCVGFDQLVITEGQIDSLSCAEAGVKNAVSVPTGGAKRLCLVYLLLYMDYPVQRDCGVRGGDCEHGAVTLLDGLSARLPKEVIVKCVRQKDYLGEKDANDILVRYGPKAVRRCVENAEIPQINNVKQLSDVKDVDINKLDKIRTGIDDLDRCIRGFSMGQLVILTGKRERASQPSCHSWLQKHSTRREACLSIRVSWQISISKHGWICSWLGNRLYGPTRTSSMRKGIILRKMSKPS